MTRPGCASVADGIPLDGYFNTLLVVPEKIPSGLKG